jgi:hypothetical protein
MTCDETVQASQSSCSKSGEDSISYSMIYDDKPLPYSILLPQQDEDDEEDWDEQPSQLRPSFLSGSNATQKHKVSQVS